MDASGHQFHSNIAMPRHCFTKGGRLYFQKQYDGKRITGAFDLDDTPGNRALAAERATLIATAMKDGFFDPSNPPYLVKRTTIEALNKTPLFSEYMEDWLQRKRGLKESTLRSYRWVLEKHVAPEFGDTRVDEITKAAVQRWLVKTLDRHSRQLSNEALRRLKAVIREAEGDYDFSSRLHLVSQLRNYDPDYDPRQTYTLEEASALYFVMGRRLRTMMLCSMLGGLRTGEVIALHWDDVLFNENVLSVKATMSDRGKREAAKTAAGRRRITMHPVLARHLLEHYQSRKGQHVFVSERGNPFYRRQSFAREYKNAVQKAGVRDLRWYAFRHLYASLRYACSDNNPVNIAREMGHTKPAVSLNIYASSMPSFGYPFAELVFPLIKRLDTQAA